MGHTAEGSSIAEYPVDASDWYSWFPPGLTFGATSGAKHLRSGHTVLVGLGDSELCDLSTLGDPWGPLHCRPDVIVSPAERSP